jgi:hypothetical protein
MHDLSICKVIAELEGLNPVELIGCCFVPHGFRRSRKYNPLDWSILGPLMVKYGITIDYHCGYVYMTQGWRGEVHFESKEDIPRAVCECILKSQGRYLNEK